jgi:tetratricopeptide (TPR) repeat protein
MTEQRSKGGALRTAGDYDTAIDGLLRAFGPRLLAMARERAAAPYLLDELRRHPPERQELLLRNSGRFRSLALCELLLRGGGEGEPASGAAVARLVLVGLNALDPALYGDGVVADFRARAWGQLADARRRGGDLAGAEAAFAVAAGHLRGGTGDCMERAQLFALAARLRQAQGRPAEALDLLRSAAATYRRLDERELEAGVLLAAAEVRGENGEPGRALCLLERARRRLGPAADPALAARLHRRLAALLAADGRPLQAEAAALRARRLERRLPTPSRRRAAPGGGSPPPPRRAPRTPRRPPAPAAPH